MSKDSASSAWAVACLVSMLLAVISLILVRGSSPLVPGAGAPAESHPLWSLPNWLGLAAMATVLLAPAIAATCAIVAYMRRSRAPLTSAFVLTGLGLLVAFVALCIA